jgi:hypothetical protein
MSALKGRDILLWIQELNTHAISLALGSRKEYAKLNNQ